MIFKTCRHLMSSFFTSFAPSSVHGFNFPSIPWRQRETARGFTKNQNFEPRYYQLHKSGELHKRGEALWDSMKSCNLCPRLCGANRIDGEAGFCGATAILEIASYHPHFGEEKSLVGTGGSGTIFLTHCSLRCVYCINWQISQGKEGKSYSINEFADIMLHLQAQGCHNINIVTPTHYIPHMFLALDSAAARGLRIPLVYNTCGWERLEVLRQLRGVVDIYLPDFKYNDPENASLYSSGAESYPEITKKALLEMHRQVGLARATPDGLMYKGLMIRHLVMPNNISGTNRVVEWLATHLPKNTYVNMMSQSHPEFKAHEYPEIARGITPEEFHMAVEWAQNAGLTNLDIQKHPLHS